MKLTVALFLLGSSTVAMAFLPGYAEIGAASAVLLGLFRVGQGLALGGAWDGLASLLALSAPERQRGWYAMIPQLGAPLGLMVASCLFAYFVANLSADDFFDWGWRYAFFVAFAINVVALFARLRIVVTPEYERQFESRDLEPAPVTETMKAEGRNIVIGAFAPLASFALFHMVTVFPLSWVFLFTPQSPARFLIIQSIGAAVGVVAIVASGVLADRFGRRMLLERHCRRDRRLQRLCAAIARWRRCRRIDLRGARLHLCSACPSARPRARSRRASRKATAIRRRP